MVSAHDLQQKERLPGLPAIACACGRVQTHPDVARFPLLCVYCPPKKTKRPEDCGKAYAELKEDLQEPRGFMFWNMEDEGRTVERTDPPRALYLAKELAAFLFDSDNAVSAHDASAL